MEKMRTSFFGGEAAGVLSIRIPNFEPTQVDLDMEAAVAGGLLFPVAMDAAVFGRDMVTTLEPGLRLRTPVNNFE